jgi:hypothetical protein
MACVALRRISQRDDIMKPIRRDVQHLSRMDDGVYGFRDSKPTCSPLRRVAPVHCGVSERGVVSTRVNAQFLASSGRVEDVAPRPLQHHHHVPPAVIVTRRSYPSINSNNKINIIRENIRSL